MSSRTVTRRSRVMHRTTPTEFAFTEDDVRQRSHESGEPSQLAERRLEAWQRYTALPMPATRDEAWRRTDIRSLPAESLSLQPADDRPVDPELLEPLAGDEHGSLLVLRPGHEPHLETEADLTRQGVIFTDWSTALREHSDLLLEHMGKVVSPADGKFAALAAAMAVDGALLYIPPGVQVEQPLHTVFWTPGVGGAAFTRVLVILGQGASATFVYEAASPTEAAGSALHAAIVELSIAQDAQLRFVELQNLGEHTWNFTHERAHIERDGRIDWIFGAVGSQLTKTFSDLDLAGEGSEGRISGFYFASGRQHLDHDTQQNHLAPNTTSDLLYKGALVEHSRSVWQGMIYVAPGAQKTDGYQANRNLLLSKNARADSIPGLEILANDVRCTHGATVGQLEEEPIFYLMSRGLPRPEAERMVIDGFFTPIMDRIPFERVRERFRKMIDAKLGVRS
jgi:Fe-S cluster assembly protein SufD